MFLRNYVLKHFYSLFFFSLLIFVNASSASVELDVKNTKIWGPGLKTSFHMPVRYFFIQAAGEDGEK